MCIHTLYIFSHCGHFVFAPKKLQACSAAVKAQADAEAYARATRTRFRKGNRRIEAGFDTDSDTEIDTTDSGFEISPQIFLCSKIRAHPFQSRYIERRCLNCAKNWENEEESKKARLNEALGMWTRDVKIREERWRVAYRREGELRLVKNEFGDGESEREGSVKKSAFRKGKNKIKERKDRQKEILNVDIAKQRFSANSTSTFNTTTTDTTTVSIANKDTKPQSSRLHIPRRRNKVTDAKTNPAIPTGAIPRDFDVKAKHQELLRALNHSRDSAISESSLARLQAPRGRRASTSTSTTSTLSEVSTAGTGTGILRSQIQQGQDSSSYIPRSAATRNPWRSAQSPAALSQRQGFGQERTQAQVQAQTQVRKPPVAVVNPTFDQIFKNNWNIAQQQTQQLRSYIPRPTGHPSSPSPKTPSFPQHLHWSSKSINRKPS